MQPRQRHVWRGHRRQRQAQHADQHDALEQVGRFGHRVFEIGTPIHQIADRQEQRLRRDAADGVGNGKARIARACRGDRHHGARKRCGRPEQRRADDRLAQPRPVGDDIGQPRRPKRAHDHHARRDGEHHHQQRKRQRRDHRRA